MFNEILLKIKALTMNGPHELTRSNVDKKVDNKIGVYVLRNSRSGPARYVGRSRELVDRLKDHSDDYRYFEYRYKSTVTKAYKEEVKLYHHFGEKDELHNQYHPRRPHKGVKCPECSLHD
jgi:predicted GIY-YIG superfamily endonuclease